MPCGDVTIRPAMPHDWERVTAVMRRVVGRPRPAAAAAHGSSSSTSAPRRCIVEHEDQLVAFLVGFLCPTTPTRPTSTSPACIRAWRRVGWRATCTGRFARVARAAGRDVVRAVTAPVNQGSIAFHTAPRLLARRPATTEVDGVPVHLDQGWTDDDVVQASSCCLDAGGAAGSREDGGAGRGGVVRGSASRRPHRPTPRRSRCSRAATCWRSARAPTPSVAASTPATRSRSSSTATSTTPTTASPAAGSAPSTRSRGAGRATCSPRRTSTARSRRRWRSAAPPS